MTLTAKKPLQTTSGDRRKQFGSDLLCDPIHSNASNPQDLPAASLLATSGCCRTDTSTSWLINLLGTHEKGPLISAALALLIFALMPTDSDLPEPVESSATSAEAK